MKRKIQVLQLLGILCSIMCIGAKSADAAALGDVFSNSPGADWDMVRDAADAQASSQPYYKSNAEESIVYEGFFKANDSTTKLAVFSDDGADVYIDGTKVHSGKGNGQALPNLNQSLHQISSTFEANRTYRVKIDYSNIVLVGDTDIDGITLFCYEGGGNVVAPPVNLQIDDVPEAEEETVGAYLPDNDDDDNYNDENDDTETGPVNNEDDLIPLNLSITPLPTMGTLTLSASAGGSNVKLWTGATKTTEVALPKSYALETDNLPSTLYVEGVNTTEDKAVEFTLTYSDGSVSSEDKVRASVFNADLYNPEDHDSFHVGEHECDIFFKALAKPYVLGTPSQVHHVYIQIVDKATADAAIANGTAIPWLTWLELKPLQADPATGGYLLTGVKDTDGSTSGDKYIRVHHTITISGRVQKPHDSPHKLVHFFQLGWPYSSDTMVTDTYHPSANWGGGCLVPGCRNGQIHDGHDWGAVRHWHRDTNDSLNHHHGIDIDSPGTDEDVAAPERGISTAYNGAGQSARVLHVIPGHAKKMKLDLDFIADGGPNGDAPRAANYTEKWVWTTIHHLVWNSGVNGNVARGDKIGEEDTSGTVGSHVHFGVLVSDTGQWPGVAGTEWSSTYTRNPNPATDYSYFYHFGLTGVTVDTTIAGGRIHPDWDGDDPNAAGAENDEDE